MRRVHFPTAALLLTLALGASPARAGDEAFLEGAQQLIQRIDAAFDAAHPAPHQRPRPPRFKNLRLRKNLGDLRDLAGSFRNRAALGQARGVLARGLLWRMKQNLRTANQLVMTGAAFGLDAFPPAFEAVRQSVAGLYAELCCGEDT